MGRLHRGARLLLRVQIPYDGFVGMIVGNAVLVAGGAFFSRYLKGDEDEDGERAAFAGMA